MSTEIGVSQVGFQSTGVTIWLTGLSGAGKTTLSQALARKLKSLGAKVEVLDSDVVREHLCKDLSFSKVDRHESNYRVGFVAHLLTRNGVIAITSAISPYRESRAAVRKLIGNFVEVYVNSPLEVCERRDVKGLYKKARSGKIKNFTGIDDPYEPPLNPEVECRTDRETIEESTNNILAALHKLGYISLYSSIHNKEQG